MNDAPIVSQPIEDLQLLEDSEAATIDLDPVFTDVDNAIDVAKNLDLLAKRLV